MIVRPAVNPREALQRLAPVMRHTVNGADLVDLVDGCTLLDVVTGDNITGTLAVQLVDGVAWCAAAADTGQHPAAAVAAFEGWARDHGARRVGFTTRRPGMVRRMLGMGYGLAQADIFKDI